MLLFVLLALVALVQCRPSYVPPTPAPTPPPWLPSKGTAPSCLPWTSTLPPIINTMNAENLDVDSNPLVYVSAGTVTRFVSYGHWAWIATSNGGIFMTFTLHAANRNEVHWFSSTDHNDDVRCHSFGALGLNPFDPTNLAAGCAITSTLEYPSTLDTQELVSPLVISFDRGLNWAVVNFTAPVTIQDIALFPSRNRLLVSTKMQLQLSMSASNILSWSNSPQLGIWQSDDGGTFNWTQVCLPQNCTTYCSLPILKMAQDTSSSGNGTYIVVVAANAGIFVSWDSGRSFNISLGFSDPLPPLPTLPPPIPVPNITNPCLTLINITNSSNITYIPIVNTSYTVLYLGNDTFVCTSNFTLVINGTYFNGTLTIPNTTSVRLNSVGHAFSSDSTSAYESFEYFPHSMYYSENKYTFLASHIDPTFSGTLVNISGVNCTYVNGTLINYNETFNRRTNTSFCNLTYNITDPPFVCPIRNITNPIRREVVTGGVIAAAVSIAVFPHPDFANDEIKSILGDSGYFNAYNRFATPLQSSTNGSLRMTWVGLASCSSRPYIVPNEETTTTVQFQSCTYDFLWSSDDGTVFNKFGPKISEPLTSESVIGDYGLGETPDPNFCMLADPYDPYIVYVAGGAQFIFNNTIGAKRLTGRIFMGNATNGTWTPLSYGQYAFNSSAPPPNCRHLAFDNVTQELIYAHDAGISVRTKPRSPTGGWETLTNNLQNHEIFSYAADRSGRRLISIRNQGIAGSNLNSIPASTARVMDPAQSSTVPIYSLNHLVPGNVGVTNTLFWQQIGSLAQFFGFYVPSGPAPCCSNLNADTCCEPASKYPGWQEEFAGTSNDLGIALSASGTITPKLPYMAVNVVNPQRCMFCVGTAVIGCYEAKYDIITNGMTNEPGVLSKLWGGDFFDVYAFGGQHSGVTDSDVVLAVSSLKIWAKTHGTASARPKANNNGWGICSSIFLNPLDYFNAILTCSKDVYMSFDFGSTWKLISSNLFELSGSKYRTLPKSSVIVNLDNIDTQKVAIVGMATGVYLYTITGPAGINNPWIRLGSTADFPSVPVRHLLFVSDTLYASTFGRGQYALRSATATFKSYVGKSAGFCFKPSRVANPFISNYYLNYPIPPSPIPPVYQRKQVGVETSVRLLIDISQFDDAFNASLQFGIENALNIPNSGRVIVTSVAAGSVIANLLLKQDAWFPNTGPTSPASPYFLFNQLSALLLMSNSSLYTAPNASRFLDPTYIPPEPVQITLCWDNSWMLVCKDEFAIKNPELVSMVIIAVSVTGLLLLIFFVIRWRFRTYVAFCRWFSHCIRCSGSKYQDPEELEQQQQFNMRRKSLSSRASSSGSSLAASKLTTPRVEKSTPQAELLDLKVLQIDDSGESDDEEVDEMEVILPMQLQQTKAEVELVSRRPSATKRTEPEPVSMPGQVASPTNKK